MLLTSSFIHGFTFDGLVSGASIEEVEHKTQIRGALLQKGENKKYTYSAKIAGNNALIVLFLGERNKLYRIHVKFNSKDVGFYEGLLKILNEKYSKSNNTGNNGQGARVSIQNYFTLKNNMSWGDGLDTITLQKSIFNRTELEYTDNQLLKMENSFVKERAKNDQIKSLTEDKKIF